MKREKVEEEWVKWRRKKGKGRRGVYRGKEGYREQVRRKRKWNDEKKGVEKW